MIETIYVDGTGQMYYCYDGPHVKGAAPITANDAAAAVATGVKMVRIANSPSLYQAIINDFQIPGNAF